MCGSVTVVLISLRQSKGSRQAKSRFETLCRQFLHLHLNVFMMSRYWDFCSASKFMFWTHLCTFVGICVRYWKFSSTFSVLALASRPCPCVYFCLPLPSMSVTVFVLVNIVLSGEPAIQVSLIVVMFSF